MRNHQLKPVWQRKFVYTADSKHGLPVFDNVLNRQFDPAVPNQAWIAESVISVPVAAGCTWPPRWVYMRVRSLTGSWHPYADGTGVFGLANGSLPVPTHTGLDYSFRPGQPGLSGATGPIRFARQYESQRQLLGYSVMERFFLNLKMEHVWRRDYANHQ
jgi:hypothetical protein